MSRPGCLKIIVPMIAAVLWALTGLARAGAAPEIGWSQNLGKALPLGLQITDDTGRTHALADFFSGVPVVFVFAYYQCPNLCTLVFNGVADALRALPERLGRDYQVLSLSIDPREGPKLALMKRRTYLAQLGQTTTTSSDWRFLTADSDTISQVASAAGFAYRYDSVSRQFEHPSGLVVLSADGRIRQYMTGIRFDPRLLSQAIQSASRFKTGSLTEQILLFCFHYDPASSRNGPRVLGLIRALGVLCALALGLGLARAFRAEGRA